MQTMKCVIKEQTGPGHLKLVERSIPKAGPNDVLVKVMATALCGTDAHIQHWNDWAAKRIKPGVIIGHEFAGEVVEVGSEVKTVKVGDIVSAETHIVCNACDLCHNGHEHVCYHTSTIGVARDGCFAEYIAIPAENAFICDPSLSIEVLSMMEPLGAAVHGVMEYPVAAKTVAIIGAGPIGAMAVAVAKQVGASRIICLEPNKMRAEMAKKMGADQVIAPLAVDPVEAVKALTPEGRGVDVVIDYSGNSAAVATSIAYSKPEAKIVVVGIASKPVSFDLGEFVYSGKTLKGIAGRLMYKTWEQTRGLLAGGLDVSPVITHVMALEKYQEGLDLMERGECGKVILKP